MPVWHASVALWPVVLVDRWPSSTKLKALTIARGLLIRRGRPGDIFEPDHPDAIAIHLRRLVSERELAIVGPATDVRPLR